MTQNVFRSGPLNLMQDISKNIGDMHSVLNVYAGASVFPLTLLVNFAHSSLPAEWRRGSELRGRMLQDM